MAKPKRKHGTGPGPSAARALDALLAEMEQAVEEIAAAAPAAAGPLWGKVHKLLIRSPADNATAASIVAGRNLTALRRTVAALRTAQAGASEPDAVEQPEESSAPEVQVAPAVLTKALRTFRKRLELLRLDEESKLSVRPLTSGKRSEIRSMQAPREFPAEVWRALVRDGRLRDAGGGFYQLIEERPGV